MAIAKKDCIAAPFGVIPQTFSFPLKLSKDQEKRILEISADMVEVWNFFIQEYSYRLDLFRRVKNETALESEKTKNNKGEFVWDTRISAQTFNYFIKPLRDTFPYLAQREFGLERGVTRKVVDSLDSYFALKKKNDPDARKPYLKTTDDFQTLVYLAKNLAKRGKNKGKLVIEKDFVLPVPQGTLNKIGDRKIASIEISRSTGKTYLPGTYSCSLVVWQNAPIPQNISRAVGVDVGSSGLALFDSRGRSFYIKMRRPDYYWRPKIAELDIKITAMQNQIKALPKSERLAAWRILELDTRYQNLLKNRKIMFNKMKNQQGDYHKKLADHIIEYGDVFFVGKSIIRSKAGKLADASNGDAEKNWNVQNTGALSGLIQLLHWRAQRAGKIVIDTQDVKYDEQNYQLRKVLQARAHLIYGLKSDVFQKSLIKHKEHFEKGSNVLFENDFLDFSETERYNFINLYNMFQKKSFNKRHVKALLQIAKKSQTEKYRKVSLKA